jgi:hypothetical protein
MLTVADSLAEGKPVAGVTWDAVDEMNAGHAKEHDAVTKEAALELPQRNSMAAAAAIRALSDEELDRAAPASLNRRSGWEGKVAAPTRGEKLSVCVSRLGEPPNAEDRRAFTEFVARYSGLVPVLSSEPFKLLGPSIQIPGWEGPSLHAAEELWPMVRLESLHISPGRPLELLFAFKGDVWPDAIRPGEGQSTVLKLATGDEPGGIPMEGGRVQAALQDLDVARWLCCRTQPELG